MSGSQFGQISIPHAFIQNLPSSGPSSPKSGYFCAPAEASTFRAAFEIFLYRGVYLRTRLFAVPVWLVQERS